MSSLRKTTERTEEESAEPKVDVITRSGSSDAERLRGRTGSRGRSPVQPGRSKSRTRSKSAPSGGDKDKSGTGMEPARVSEYALDPEPNNSVVVRGTSAQATEYVFVNVCHEVFFFF